MKRDAVTATGAMLVCFAISCAPGERARASIQTLPFSRPAELPSAAIAPEPPATTVIGDPDPAPPPPQEIDSVVGAPEISRETEPLFDRPFKSLKVRRSAWVRATPSNTGAQLGMISAAARPKYKSHSVNDECETPWIEIAPRGWICTPVKPSKKAPTTRPKAAERPLLGKYALARRAARFYKSLEEAAQGGTPRHAKGDIVRLTSSTILGDGRKLWRTQLGEWVDAKHIVVLYGSDFEGVRLVEPAGLRLPIGFAVNQQSKRARGSVKVYAAPSHDAKVVGRLVSKTPVSVDASPPDAEFVSIDDGWVRRQDLRIAAAVAKPPEAGDGYWVDVDTDEQVVVVYKGDVPVFATLGSTGQGDNPTPTGVFRVTRKKRQTTMMSDRGRAQSYSVSVPWPTYFHEGFAFHSAYWHNSFGTPRSHGCINLAPKDALTLHRFLGPELPAGWLAVYSEESSQPGSVVQIRARVSVPLPAKDSGNSTGD